MRPSKRKAPPGPLDDDHPLQLLVTGKHMGLGFEELNVLRMDDFAGFIDGWIGADEDAPRKATQEDINRMLA